MSHLCESSWTRGYIYIYIYIYIYMNVCLFFEYKENVGVLEQYTKLALSYGWRNKLLLTLHALVS